MDTITILVLGSLAIIFALLWRARIRKSRNQDPDFARRDAAKEKLSKKESIL